MPMTATGKKRLGILALVVVLLGGGLAGAYLYRNASKQRIASEAYDKGMAAYEQGDYKTALPLLSAYIQQNKDDYETLLAFAETRAKVPAAGGSHLRSAINLYLVADNKNPDNIKILDGLLDLYRRSGRRVELMRVARNILEIDSNHIEALESLAFGHRQEGEFDQAADYTKRLVELDQDNFNYRMLHLNNLERQSISNESVMEVANQWVEDAPAEDGAMLLLKAMLLATFDLPEQANETAQRAADRGATEATLKPMLEVLDGMGRRDLSEKLLAQSREKYGDTTWIAEIVVRREWQAGRVDNAQKELEKVAGDGLPDQPELLRLAALLHAVDNNTDKARQAIAQLEELAETEDSENRDRTRAWAKAVAARLDVANSSWESALDAYEEARNLNPNDAIIHYLSGEAYFGVNEFELAATSFDNAFTTDPMWIAAGSSLAESYFRLGRLQDAYSIARDLVMRTSPRILSPWRIWFATWVELEEADLTVPDYLDKTKSRRDLLAVLESFYNENGHVEALAPLLARAHLLNGETGEAKAMFDAALASEERNAGLLLAFAEINFDNELGMEKPLLDAADELIGITPHSASIRARVLANRGEKEQGLDVLKSAIEASDSPSANWQRLVQYMQAANVEGTLEEVESHLKSGEATSNDLAYIMTLPSTWEHENLVNLALDQMEQKLGEDSKRVILGRATHVLQYQPKNAKAVSQAILDLDGLLERTPESLPALTTMANLLLLGDNPDRLEAIDKLRTAVDYYPTQTHLYPQLIDLLQKVGDFDDAERYLAQLDRQTDLDEGEQRIRVQLLREQGQYDRAYAALASLNADTDNPVDQVALASLSLKAGRRDEAREIVDNLLEKYPNELLVLRFAANFYSTTEGMPEKGLEILERAELDQPGMKSLLIGSFHHRQGDHAEAEKWLKQATVDAPSDPIGWMFLAQHFMAIEDLAGARRAAMKGQELDPENEDLKVLLASIDLGTDSAARSEAIRIFEELRGDNRALIETMKLFDRTATDDQGFSVSERDLEDARELTEKFPSFVPAWRLAMRLHIHADKRGDALDLARRAMNKLPANPLPAVWAVDLYQQEGRANEAIGAAREWRERTLDDPIEADITIAAINRILNKPKDGLTAIAPHRERIEREASRFPNRMKLLIELLLLNGEIDEAYGLIKDDTGNARRWVNTWLQTSMQLADSNAIKALEQIEEIALLEAITKLDLATSWTLLGQRTNNADMFDKAEQLAMDVSADDDPRAQMAGLRLRAMLSDARGEPEQSMVLYEQILAELPNDPTGLNNSAYVLSTKLNRHQDALRHSEKLIRLYPDVAEFLDTHAQVLLGMDRVDEAEKFAEEALEMSSRDPGIMITLARIYAKQNRKSEARRLFERARRAVATAPFQDDAMQAHLDELEDWLSR